MTKGGVHMSVQVLFELGVLEDFSAGRRSRVEAVLVLGCSEKSITRKAKILHEGGSGALRHANRRRVPVNKTAEAVRDEALRLAVPIYSGFNIAYCHEMMMTRDFILLTIRISVQPESLQ